MVQEACTLFQDFITVLHAHMKCMVMCAGDVVLNNLLFCCVVFCFVLCCVVFCCVVVLCCCVLFCVVVLCCFVVLNNLFFLSLRFSCKHGEWRQHGLQPRLV